jgi:putative (di)nucleoside polyphosphate hydrolase
MKTASHGLLLLNLEEELLLCHATGSRHWDVPKGAAAEGESSAQAACREAREECGLTFNAGDLHEVGCFAYRPQKDLCLHAMLIERIDLDRCACTSFFVDRHGRRRPEMDRFQWAPFSDVPYLCAKSMAVVLTESVSLPRLLSLLSARSRRGSPGSRGSE